ncbi:DUF2691 family protein [Clostridium sp. DSM 100503]|uniref:DUF2691 family protein n=1 Tax=Clostridium sp. DSM 100503 TaxID=2963282 RepID=UPI00214A4B21|nr:DUF2691 family protein [Clostridium sp. DSM 100503]MCR1952866.1 DUF2691 family protein [Clostridium sp. DSM 100503]
MIKGIKFNIPNKKGKYLYEVLNSINVLAYKWFINEDDIYCIENYKNLFQDQYLNGYEFKDIIMKNEYYIINTEIRAFSDEVKYENIQTYEDFLQSNVEILIIIIDSEYGEIYCKNESMLSNFYKEFKSSNFNPMFIKEDSLRKKICIF